MRGAAFRSGPRTRWSWTSAGRPPTLECWCTGSRARRPSPSTSAGYGPTFACPMSSRSVSAAAAWYGRLAEGCASVRTQLGTNSRQRAVSLAAMSSPPLTLPSRRERSNSGIARTWRISIRGWWPRPLDEIHRMVDVAVDRMRLSAAPIPVILVGGGAILICRPIQGASEIVKPNYSVVANAVGAAIGQVGGEVDRVFSLVGLNRDQALEEAKNEANSKAVAAGADPTTIRVVDVEDIPLSYLPGNAVRVRVKAIGDLFLT